MLKEQFDEMYAVPESFLEIEIRNPMTHGEIACYYACVLSESTKRIQVWAERCIPTTRLYAWYVKISLVAQAVNPSSWQPRRPSSRSDARPTSPLSSSAIRSFEDDTQTLRRSAMSSRENRPELTFPLFPARCVTAFLLGRSRQDALTQRPWHSCDGRLTCRCSRIGSRTR